MIMMILMGLMALLVLIVLTRQKDKAADANGRLVQPQGLRNALLVDQQLLEPPRGAQSGKGRHLQITYYRMNHLHGPLLKQILQKVFWRICCCGETKCSHFFFARYGLGDCRDRKALKMVL